MLSWCLSLIQVLNVSSWCKQLFISCFSQSTLVSFSGWLSPHICWDDFHKPTTFLFFSLLSFQQLRPILLVRLLAKFIGVSSCHSFLYSLLPYELVPILLFRRLCDIALLGQSCCSIKIMVSLALFSCLLWILSNSLFLSNFLSHFPTEVLPKFSVNSGFFLMSFLISLQPSRIVGFTRLSKEQLIFTSCSFSSSPSFILGSRGEILL